MFLLIDMSHFLIRRDVMKEEMIRLSVLREKIVHINEKSENTFVTTQCPLSLLLNDLLSNILNEFIETAEAIVKYFDEKSMLCVKKYW